MLPVALARVPTRMLFERHPAIDYDVFLLLQRHGAGEKWVPISQKTLAAPLARSVSSVRRALRRLIAGRYVAVQRHIVIDGRWHRVAYRALL